jgi:hypothetical protein
MSVGSVAFRVVIGESGIEKPLNSWLGRKKEKYKATGVP